MNIEALVIASGQNIKRLPAVDLRRLWRVLWANLVKFRWRRATLVQSLRTSVQTFPSSHLSLTEADDARC